MDAAQYQSLLDGTVTEVRALLDRVVDNGSVTLKPGSPALAILYAYDELLTVALATWQSREAAIKDILES